MMQTIANPRSGTRILARNVIDRWLYAAVLLAVLLIRAPVAGHLNYHIDEGFYLLVGERMRDGLLPYVDVWDRKPFGLFLLYWLIATLGKGSMIAVHLAAGISAATTAMLIAVIARHWAAPLPAGLAAIAYLAGLEALAGGGGQSPVFYNLPMVAMAALALKAGYNGDLAHSRRLAMAAVLCGGIALTIKQTSLPECVFFGTVLVVHARHFAPSIAAWVREVALLACLGAMPSLVCLGFFTLIGHGGDYLFATLLSSFGRAPMAGTERLSLALYLAPRILPLLVMALAGVSLLLRNPTRSPGAGILAGWIAAGTAGFLMVPNFYDHYALPLLPSLCVGAAPLFARCLLGPVYALLVIGISLIFAGWPAFERTRSSNAGMQAAARAITAHGGGTSLYVFDGPVHLYALAGAPLPTRWVFPEHLSTAEERNATGADATAELARILRTRPAVIVAADGSGARHPNTIAWQMVRKTLVHHYKPVKKVTMPEFRGPRTVQIFARH